MTARISPYSYGVLADVVYEPSNAEHRRRRHLVYASATLGKLIGPTFSCVAKKHERIPTSKEIRALSYRTEVKNTDDAQLTVALYAHDGNGPAPLWFEEKRKQFFKVCDIRANLSEQCTPEARSVTDGKEFWVLSLSIELTLGSTEIQARAKWQNNGQTEYSDAQVVYA